MKNGPDSGRQATVLISHSRPGEALPADVDSGAVELSIVVPAFNEEEGLLDFYDAVSRPLSDLVESWELLFVDDGSSDRTFETLLALREKDSRVRVLRFSRNFGHQTAITAGMQYARGRAVVTMDADLQHPPELIAEMYDLWKRGHHVVYTIRTYGKEISWFKRKSSEWFYALCNVVSDVEFVSGAADFRLMDRRVVDCFNAMPEKSRFVRGMVRWLGFRQTGVSYTANARKAGVSKYTFLKMLSFAVDGMTSFSTRPLRWITYIGFLTALSVVPYGLWAVAYYFIADENVFTHGWPSLMVAILFLGGLNLVSMGIIGEYVGRIYAETKGRPLFVLQESLGFEESVSRRDDATVSETVRAVEPTSLPERSRVA